MHHALLILLVAAAAPADDAAVKLAASGLLNDGRYCEAVQLLTGHHERTGSAESAYNAGLISLKANDRVRAARLLESVADDAGAGKFRDPSRRFASRIRRLIDREGPGASCPGAAGETAVATGSPAPPLPTAPGAAPAPPAASPAATAPARPGAAAGAGAAVVPGPAPAAAPAAPAPAPAPAAVAEAGEPFTTGRTFMARLERETEVRTAGYAVETATPAGPAPASMSSRSVAGYSLFAAGGVAVLVGGIFTASARSQADALEADAGGSTPPIFDAQRRAAFDAFQTNRTAGFAGLASGMVLATAGAILLLTESP